MAKELPYFKFEPNQWENGNIQICSREDKGLFMDLCSMYWSRLGDVPLKLAIQKLCGGNATAFNSLCDENIISVIDGNICIDFLNEQLQGFENTSKQNSQNARDGWQKRRKNKSLSDRNATALISQSENDAIREEKKRKEKKRKENKIPALSEFLEYGFEKQKDLDPKALELKYDAWVTNGWKDGNQKKIINWKSKLLNTIPHLPKKNTLVKHRKIQL